MSKYVNKMRDALMAFNEKALDIRGGMADSRERFSGDYAAEEIDDMNMPYPAYQRTFELVMAAVTGEDPEEITKRFQGEKND